MPRPFLLAAEPRAAHPAGPRRKDPTSKTESGAAKKPPRY